MNDESISSYKKERKKKQDNFYFEQPLATQKLIQQNINELTW